MDAVLELGIAGLPMDGQLESGDLAVYAPYPGGALVGAIDGLGHGRPAWEAARLAADVAEEHRSDDLSHIFLRCHRRLAGTRGAVVTLARFDAVAQTVTWLGVGNVDARLVRAGREPGEGHVEVPLLLGGVVGHQLPVLRPTRLPVAVGDTLVLATDGVRQDLIADLAAVAPAQRQAEALLARHRRGNDDALVVVARYRGPPAA